LSIFVVKKNNIDKKYAVKCLKIQYLTQTFKQNSIMRKRLEQQLSFGQISIGDVQITTKCRDAFPKLLRALQELFMNSNYNEQIFSILEDTILKDKQATGRKGMDLWILFVMAQTRLCLNISYDRLYHMSNNDVLMRKIMGVEYNEYMRPREEFEYQNIIDNVSLLDDQTLVRINQVIVEMGHEVFKKKEAEPLRLKTDSFVVESTVHFPTDYNLLFDSGSKCLSIIKKFIKTHPELTGWRKLEDWRRELKNQMRILWQATKSTSKDRDEKVKEEAKKYIRKAELLNQKFETARTELEIINIPDLLQIEQLNYYQGMLSKHIELVERRLVKDEEIPHEEKEFSVFEEYTEWINKGKQHPSVELGKNVQITTDQYNLIIDHKVMEHEVDKSTVIPLFKKLSEKWDIGTWSFDKGFYTKENKAELKKEIPQLVLPKKGKLNEQEKAEESDLKFKQLRHAHSAVESNINELEFKGLDRCPDRGYEHFKMYVALGVTAYNLHKIGNELLKQERIQEKRKRFKNVA